MDCESCSLARQTQRNYHYRAGVIFVIKKPFSDVFTVWQEVANLTCAQSSSELFTPFDLVSYQWDVCNFDLAQNKSSLTRNTRAARRTLLSDPFPDIHVSFSEKVQVYLIPPLPSAVAGWEHSKFGSRSPISVT